MASKTLGLKVIVNDCKMYLKIMIDEEYILIPFEEAHKVVSRINQLVPYNYGDVIFQNHKFEGFINVGE